MFNKLPYETHPRRFWINSKSLFCNIIYYDSEYHQVVTNLFNRRHISLYLNNNLYILNVRIHKLSNVILYKFSNLIDKSFVDIKISQFPMISNDIVNEYIFVTPHKTIHYTEYKPYNYHNCTDFV